MAHIGGTWGYWTAKITMGYQQNGLISNFFWNRDMSKFEGASIALVFIPEQLQNRPIQKKVFHWFLVGSYWKHREWDPLISLFHSWLYWTLPESDDNS